MPQFHALRSYKHTGGGLLSKQAERQFQQGAWQSSSVSGSVVSSVIVEGGNQDAQWVEQETQRQQVVPLTTTAPLTTTVPPRGSLLLPPGVVNARVTRNLQQTTGVLHPPDPSTTGVQISHVTRNLQMMSQGLQPGLPVPAPTSDRYVSLSLPLRYTQIYTRRLRAIAVAARGRTTVVIIPGKRRQTRETDALAVSGPLHLSSRVRQMLLLLATVCIFAFCMVTMTPLSQTPQGIFSLHLVAMQNTLSFDSPQNSQDSQDTTVQAAGSEEYYRELARADAAKYGISPYYYERQIQQESHFDPNARSIPGAIGIAQFMPETASEYGFDPHDPVASLDGGARYMRDLNNMFYGDYSKALAAYNAGPGAVDAAVESCGSAWLSCMDGQPQAYVYIIMGY